MTYSTHKVKPLKEKDSKKFSKIEADITNSDILQEIKMFKLNLLKDVGWKNYVSWFRAHPEENAKKIFPLGTDYPVFYRSGWFVIVMPMNEWKKKTMNMKFKHTLSKLKIILQNED